MEANKQTKAEEKKNGESGKYHEDGPNTRFLHHSWEICFVWRIIRRLRIQCLNLGDATVD
jgi:hypothetical protein